MVWLTLEEKWKSFLVHIVKIMLYSYGVGMNKWNETIRYFRFFVPAGVPTATATPTSHLQSVLFIKQIRFIQKSRIFVVYVFQLISKLVFFLFFLSILRISLIFRQLSPIKKFYFESKNCIFFWTCSKGWFWQGVLFAQCININRALPYLSLSFLFIIEIKG